jgi:hypothetical protein
MKTKLLIALLGFAGLASLGRASVECGDLLYRREVVGWPGCESAGCRVVYVQAEPPRPRHGWYQRVVYVRRDGCREIRYVYVADGRRHDRR